MTGCKACKCGTCIKRYMTEGPDSCIHHEICEGPHDMPITDEGLFACDKYQHDDGTLFADLARPSGNV